MKRVIIGALILVVVAVVAVAALRRGGNGDENGITEVEVTRGTIVDKALAVGSITPRQEINVKSKISGVVKHLYVDMGDKVEAGDPLLEIAPDPTPMELAQARREAEIAEVGASKCHSDLERARDLCDKDLLSEAQYDRTERDYQEADLRLQLARERLSLLEEGRAVLADRIIENVVKSKVRGTILQRHVDEGDPVVPLVA